MNLFQVAHMSSNSNSSKVPSGIVSNSNVPNNLVNSASGMPSSATGTLTIVNSNANAGYNASSGSGSSIGKIGGPSGQSSNITSQSIPSQMSNNSANELTEKIASVRKVWDDSTPPSVSTPSSSTSSSIRHSSPSTQVTSNVGQQQGQTSHGPNSQFDGHQQTFTHHASLGDEAKLVNLSFSNEPMKSKSPRSTSMSISNVTSGSSSGSKPQLNAQTANVGSNMIVPPYGALSNEFAKQMHKNVAATLYQQQQQQQQMNRGNNLPGSSPPVLLNQVNSPPPLDHSMRHHAAAIAAHNHFIPTIGSSQVHPSHHGNHPNMSTAYSIYPAFTQQLQAFAQQVANAPFNFPPAAPHHHQHLLQQQAAAAAAVHHHQQQQQQAHSTRSTGFASNTGGDLTHDAYRMSAPGQPPQGPTQGPTGGHGTPNSNVTSPSSTMQQQQINLAAQMLKQSLMQAGLAHHAVHPIPHPLQQATAAATAGPHSFGAPGQGATQQPQQPPPPQGSTGHPSASIGSYFTPSTGNHVPSASMYHAHVAAQVAAAAAAHHGTHPHQAHATHPPPPHPHAQFAPATGQASSVTAAYTASNQVSNVNQQQPQPQQSQQQPNQPVASSSQAFRQTVSRNRNRF